VFAVLGPGCGYAPIRGDGAPVAVLAVGVVADHSPEGELGLVVSEAARVAIGARARPRLGEGGPTLVGAVRVGAEAPLGFDGTGFATAYTAPVTLTVHLQGADGIPRWRGTPVVHAARWLRSPTPQETRAARRLALEAAARAALAEALDDLWQAPPLPEAGGDPQGASGPEDSDFDGESP
jgi:hypothetical protein